MKVKEQKVEQIKEVLRNLCCSMCEMKFGYANCVDCAEHDKPEDCSLCTKNTEDALEQISILLDD